MRSAVIVAALATAAIVLLAGAAILGAYVNLQIERYDRFEAVSKLYNEGDAAIDRGEFEAAQIWLGNAEARAEKDELGTYKRLFRWGTIWDFGGKLQRRLELLWTSPPMEDLQSKILLKSKIATEIITARAKAENLLDRSESLRFRLIGLGKDLPGAIRELIVLLEPFYVLRSSQNWAELDHIWALLDETQRLQVRHEVNELLFLWMIGIEGSLRECAGITRDGPTGHRSQGARPGLGRLRSSAHVR